MYEFKILVKYHEDINKYQSIFEIEVNKDLTKLPDILGKITSIKREDELSIFIDGKEIHDRDIIFQGDIRIKENSIMRIFNKTRFLENEQKLSINKYLNFLNTVEFVDKVPDSNPETENPENNNNIITLQKKFNDEVKCKNGFLKNKRNANNENINQMNFLTNFKIPSLKRDLPYEIKSKLSPIPDSPKINRSLFLKAKEKINLVLDLDETCVYVKYITDTNEIIENDVFKVDIEGNFFKFKFRNHLIDFIKNVSDLCNIYVYTNALKPLAEAVIGKINEHSTVKIPKSNIIYAQKASDRGLKTLYRFFLSSSFSNCLILDDNMEAWEDIHIKNIIPTRKFIAFFKNQVIQSDQHNSTFNYNYLYKIHQNECVEFDSEYEKRINLDENGVLYHVEYDYSKNFQLMFMENLIIKVFNTKEEKSIPAIDALEIISKGVLKDCKINIRYLDKDVNKKLILDIVKFLGGEVCMKELKSTHILIGNKNRFPKQILDGRFYLNIRWIFDCYFFCQKMEEKSYL